MILIKVNLQFGYRKVSNLCVFSKSTLCHKLLTLVFIINIQIPDQYLLIINFPTAFDQENLPSFCYFITYFIFIIKCFVNFRKKKKFRITKMDKKLLPLKLFSTLKFVSLLWCPIIFYAHIYNVLPPLHFFSDILFFILVEHTSFLD